MTLRAPSLLWIVVLLALLSCNLAYACSCAAGDQRPCHQLSTTHPVFTGKALTLDPVPNKDGVVTHFHHWRMRVAVEEVFRGELPAEVEITTGSGGGDCGEPLEPGHRYLLHAYQSDEGLHISICSGDRRLDRADDPEIASLRRVARSRLGSIYGTVRRAKRNIKKDELGDASSLASIRVVAKSGQKTFTTETNANGNYEFGSLLPGSYELSFSLPKNYDYEHDSEDSGRVEVYAGGCTERNLIAMPNGRIRGSVLGRDGKPVSGLSVTLLPADDSEPDEFDGIQDRTGDRGEFTFEFVPAGTYVLGVNLTWVPSRQKHLPRVYLPGTSERANATSLEVREGQLTENLQLWVPFTTEDLKKEE